MFAVLVLEESQHVGINAFPKTIQQLLELKWADGMVGVIPVFQDRASAEKYAEGKAEVVELIMKADNVSKLINLGENQSIINK